MTFLDDVIARLRAWDADRPRSAQQQVGWSEVGGCRSYLGYRLAGEWESDDTDNWAAIRGTAIHRLLEEVITGPGYLTEVETSYRGIPGHADLVDTTAPAVWDYKTSKLSSIRLWQSSPAVLRQKRIQVHGYAAGLVDAGIIPGSCDVGLLAVPADGTFADFWLWREPFDRALADEGADRLEQVRERMAAGEPLPKDMPYQWCESYCGFFSLCRAGDGPDGTEEITDPELAAAVAAYGETSARIGALYKDKDRYADMIRGLRGTAGQWRISMTREGEKKEVLDEDWIRADYEARGESVPVVLRPGAAPRLNVTRVRKAGGSDR